MTPETDPLEEIPHEFTRWVARTIPGVGGLVLLTAGLLTQNQGLLFFGFFGTAVGALFGAISGAKGYWTIGKTLWKEGILHRAAGTNKAFLAVGGYGLAAVAATILKPEWSVPLLWISGAVAFGIFLLAIKEKIRQEKI